MNTTASTKHTAQLDILKRATRKRCAAEIELELESSDDEPQIARTRLLACDEDFVYIDRPTLEGMPLELATDTPAVVFFMCDGDRFAFRSRIAEECKVPIGGDHTIPGFAMPLPDHVQRQERRLDCRASLAQCQEVIAELHLAEPAACEECFEARLLNISAGGLAAIAFDVQGHKLVPGTKYRIVFELPGIKNAFEFDTALRRVRNLKESGSILAMKFLSGDNAAEMRRAVRQVSQFVAKQLKKNPRKKAPKELR